MKTIAFIVLTLMFLNWLLGFVKAIIDPDWYYSKRMAAGHSMPDSMNQFYVVKVIQIGLTGAFLFVLGEDLGYWE